MAPVKGTGALTADNRPLGEVVWALNERDVQQLISLIWTSGEVVIDLETTGLDMHATATGPTNGGIPARVVLASLTLPQQGVDYGDGTDPDVQPPTWVLPLSHPDSPFSGGWRNVLRKVCDAIVQCKLPVSNQNMKFDARWIYALTGVALEHLIVWDTQVSSHLLDETISTSLKDRAPAVFGITRWDDHDLSKPGAAERVPVYALGEYAARDTYWTWRLKVHARRTMFLEGEEALAGPQTPEDELHARLGKVAAWVAMPMVASLTRMEQRGMQLDVPWTRQHLEEDIEIRERSLDSLADLFRQNRKEASTEANSYWFKELTKRSVDAGMLQIISMTESGNPQWTKGNLTRLSSRWNESSGPNVAQLILDARGATKRAQYLRSWLHFVTPEGLIHSTYHPGRVVTGRLSSSDPNMQQVTKKLKPAFVPRLGFVHIDLDYSQIELRTAAFVARCIPMIEAFRRGDDLHKIFAGVINNIPTEQVTPEQRQGAKAGNFGLLYEMSPTGFQLYAEDSYGVVMSLSEAQKMHQAFFDLWVGIREWHARVKRRLQHDGYVVSPLGRVRRLPGVWDSNGGMRGFAERAGINAPIQSFASDLMQMAAASIQGLLPGSVAVPGAFVVATVHDNIVVEAPVDRWEEVRDACIDRMVNLDYVLRKMMGIDFDVPLVAEAMVGSRWGWNDLQDPGSYL